MQESTVNIKTTTSDEAIAELSADKVIVRLRVKGVFVEKRDLREAIGIDSDYYWYELIKVCKKINGFTDLYADYRTHNCVTRSLARIIAKKAHDGEVLVFKYLNKNS